MPPCKKVLLNKIYRTNQITQMIKGSRNPMVYIPQPTNGWTLDAKNRFRVEYFDGNAYPEDVNYETDQDGESEVDDSDNSIILSDSDDDKYYDSEDCNSDDEVEYYEDNSDKLWF